MAAGGASLLAAAIFSLLVMSSLGYSRPLCSDCDLQCRNNCNAKVETACSSSCNVNPQDACRSHFYEQCTKQGFCCSSNGTCTCDCNTEAQSHCNRISDNYTDCQACEQGMSQNYQDCYPTCNKDCEKNCKKKKGCHA